MVAARVRFLYRVSMPDNGRVQWRVTAVALLGLVVLLIMLKEGPVHQGPLELSAQEKKIALDLARASLRAHLEGGSPLSIDERTLPATLREKAACFVTLTKSGSLRGCILDSFQPHESAARNIARNAILAATVDTRFDAVGADELARLTIEVSILGHPYAIPHSPPERLLASIRPGVDGVILRTRYGTSTFLPQVWEQIPDASTFLAELCRKHGAPSDAWRTSDLLRVEIYQVNHFSEADTP